MVRSFQVTMCYQVTHRCTVRQRDGITQYVAQCASDPLNCDNVTGKHPTRQCDGITHRVSQCDNVTGNGSAGSRAYRGMLSTGMDCMASPSKINRLRACTLELACSRAYCTRVCMRKKPIKSKACEPAGRCLPTRGSQGQRGRGGISVNPPDTIFYFFK